MGRQFFPIAIAIILVGCAQYNGGRSMPLNLFHEKLSKLTKAQYLSPAESDLRLADSSCVAVGYHRMATPIGAFLGDDIRNAADAVDSQVIYKDRADSYSLDKFKWIEAAKGTQLNLQIISIDCFPTSLTVEAVPEFDLSFEEEVRRKEEKVVETKALAEAKRNAEWEAPEPARRAAWDRLIQRSQPPKAPKGSPPKGSPIKKPPLNGAYLTGQTSVVGGSLCEYSDGTVVKVSGSYCPRRN
jgi:hypothetical protein